MKPCAIATRCTARITSRRRIFILIRVLSGHSRLDEPARWKSSAGSIPAASTFPQIENRLAAMLDRENP
jgi:hypothetical protein